MFLALSQNLPCRPCSSGKNPLFPVNKSAHLGWLVRFSLSLPSSINRSFVLRHHLLACNSPRDIKLAKNLYVVIMGNMVGHFVEILVEDGQGGQGGVLARVVLV